MGTATTKLEVLYTRMKELQDDSDLAFNGFCKTKCVLQKYLSTPLVLLKVE